MHKPSCWCEFLSWRLLMPQWFPRRWAIIEGPNLVVNLKRIKPLFLLFLFFLINGRSVGCWLPAPRPHIDRTLSSFQLYIIYFTLFRSFLFGFFGPAISHFKLKWCITWSRTGVSHDQVIFVTDAAQPAQSNPHLQDRGKMCSGRLATRVCSWPIDWLRA